jgi:4-hydroxy-4-methyl-2-oxoglutarate aldolase
MAKPKKNGRASKADAGARTLSRRLSRQSSDTIADVLDVMGLGNQTLGAAIRPLTTGMRLAGPAFCVRGRPIDKSNPAPAGAPYEVDRSLTPGSVVVTATGGHTVSAVIGGNVVASYKRHGCAGLVVDGAVRDSAEIRALRIPTFTTHVTPRRPAGRWSVVEHGQPISIPGQSGSEVVIHPGDFILGDEDGVVVIPQAIAAEVLDAAEKLTRIEAKVVRDIRRGRDREETLRAYDRFGHIRKIVPPSGS